MVYNIYLIYKGYYRINNKDKDRDKGSNKINKENNKDNEEIKIRGSIYYNKNIYKEVLLSKILLISISILSKGLEQYIKCFKMYKTCIGFRVKSMQGGGALMQPGLRRWASLAKSPSLVRGRSRYAGSRKQAQDQTTGLVGEGMKVRICLVASRS
ncbi:hypothetical protein B0T21DRAFT_347318 [Apiosordaria backusii]|uniref:Uncharacterized protein n=1 Tax=Apiosordaria backusii TaxID=314023 RepID=A0AA40BMD0_9PEZI|nr:hypothetical protein B0T21DRAFT_347318 [Apiosordaria backusii]